MNSFRSFKFAGHPARFPALLQSFCALFLLGILCGCSTTPGQERTRELFPKGMYVFDAPFVYEEGMARVTPIDRGAKVQLLETFEGSFELHLRNDQELVIRNDDMSYPTLARSFRGKGALTEPGAAEGTATIRIRSPAMLWRDHREGEWSIRQATEEETRRFERRRRQLEERKRRAQGESD